MNVMKKFLLSTLVLVIFIVYALHTNLAEEQSSTIAINTPGVVFPTPVSTETPAASTGPTSVSTPRATRAPAPVPVATPAGRYKNGTYTGSVADAFYGNIQVQVTISGGNITDVQFLQYPSDRSTSVYINSQAMPLLKQEAIQAQSAQVSGVSGATATSGAFIQSLGSALSQAS
jgi:uncharacterized protein with FMN-binding domain